jgi:arylsulfatase A-like enzyme
MKAVFVLFDSLCRNALGCYGSRWVRTPQFDRFAQRAVTFDRHFVGSLPCMPARRDLHTGRLNFMHRSWGPLEPFDNSFAQSMWEAGIHTHLVSDHLHYWEDGGSTYHTRFRSWDCIRGNEYDPWKAMVQPPVERLRAKYAAKHYDFDSSWRRPKHRYDGSWKRIQHAINHEFMVDEKDLPLARCFASAFEFLDVNRGADSWFLMLECFDPHEPFHAPARFKEQYETSWNGGILDWPIYEKTTDSTPEEIAEIRANYAALVAACDDYFGKLLDYFDRHDLWRDTALVLSTDHGFLLAEHDWWGKNLQPYYTEISHIPLIVHHPGFASRAGTRRDAVTQTMDLMPTFLDVFDLAKPREVRARSLMPLLDADAAHRDIGIFGMFGGPIGATDGRYTYYLYPRDLYAPGLHEYTLMPMHLSSLFSESEMRTAVMAKPFDFTKGMPVMKIDALMDARRIPMHDDKKFDPGVGTTLYDLATDPTQSKPIRDAAIELRFHAGNARELRAHDAPVELYARYQIDTRTAEAATTKEETL